MSRNQFRIGSIAVLFAVVVLCVAIFGVLTVSSAVSDRRAAERYGEHVEVLYACENAGQDWLSEADAYLKGAEICRKTPKRPKPRSKRKSRAATCSLRSA